MNEVSLANSIHRAEATMLIRSLSADPHSEPSRADCPEPQNQKQGGEQAHRLVFGLRLAVVY